MRRVLLCLFLLMGITSGDAYCRPKTDTSHLILRGKQLLKLSPVCYYYNHLLQQKKKDGNLIGYMPVVYVAEHDDVDGAWMIADAEGYKITAKDILALDRDERPNENSYQYYMCKTVKVDGDMLSIDNAEGSNVVPETIKAKLYYDARKRPLLLMWYGVAGRYQGPAYSYSFYLLDNNKWNNITDSIVDLPTDIQPYFKKPIDTALLRKYNCFAVDINFRANTDTVSFYAYFNDAAGFDCEQPANQDALTEREIGRVKICETIRDNEGWAAYNYFYYVLDKKRVKFKKVSSDRMKP